MRGSNLIANGNSVLNKDLDVFGDVTFNSSYLAIESEARINSSWLVNGSASVQDLNVYGNVHMRGSNLTVDGHSVLNKDLDVFGNVTFHGSNLAIECETTINSNL